MAVKIQLDRKKITLGVGDLVAEPLNGNGRVAGLSAWTRMALGREVHVRHQRSQADLHVGYAREMVVRYKTTVDDFAVTIQGRIDGVYTGADGESVVIEEIKSVVLPAMLFVALDADSYPHYAEQLRLYCFFAEQEGKRATGRLVFVNVADGSRRDVELAGPFADCEKLIADRVRALIDRAYDEQRHREERRKLANGLPFPHDKPRKYQDEMIAAVEHTLETGRHLLVSAPAGIGKTAGALHPVMKFAFANDKRVFFITSKNTQQQIVGETLRRLRVPTAVLFRAREQMCINDVYACREEFCPHLRDFAVKLEQTRCAERLLEKRLITPDALIETGQQTKLCPFELALVEAEMTDVIVCDYNYVFDPQVYFRRFFQDADYSNAVLIIDEAHNLLQRAMDYYSPSLSRQQLQELAGNLRHVEPGLAKELRRFLGELEQFFRNTAQPRGDEYSQLEDEPERSAEKFLIPPPRAFFDDLKPTFTALAIRYMLEKTTSGRAIPDDPVDEFFSAYGSFCSVLAMEGEEFSYILDTTGGQSLKILCKDPSRQLAQRLTGFHSVIAMSATLAPMEFYRQMLGFDPERTDSVNFPSPFPRENRKIVVVPNVSTTYRYRAGAYGRIAEIIAQTAGARRGNYMALFPSYEFLRAVADRLPRGEWETLVQAPKMSADQRERLVESLKEADRPKLVLAVQGGLFAEGVDYPGETLSGVIVVSPALPQVSFERDLMRTYYDEKYGLGFEFAYLYPGMNRVIQSVGRLIRSETDRGVAVLVCQRFATAQYSALFPADWSQEGVKSLICSDLETQLGRFWEGFDEQKRP